MWRKLTLLLITCGLFNPAALLPLLAAPKTGEPAPKRTPVRYKDGDDLLAVFAPISKALRHSVVKIDVNGSTSALATVVDASGLALTKASELKPGKLTSWIAGGKEVAVTLLATDEQSDLALLKIDAEGLVPVQWAKQDVAVGQWTVSPGTEETPHAVGIVSVPPRKILPRRAYIGVTIDTVSDEAKISGVSPGLAADKAGIKSEDVIMAVDGVKIKDGKDLIETLRTFREGQSVVIKLRRGDDEQDVEVKMMPEQEMFGRRLFDRQSFMNRMGGEVSSRSEDFGMAIQHDTVLEPWLCGGPLVNLDQKAVGINIARAGRVASYALPANLVEQALVRLRAQSQPKPPAAKATGG